MNFIAHRGFPTRHPENSLPGFAAAVEYAACGKPVVGIELDIHLTEDGKIPVMHETRLDGDNGAQIAVAQLTFAEVQCLFKQQHGDVSPDVPTIDEVFTLINHSLEINCEIKAGDYDLNRFTRIFSKALSDYSPAGDIVISSFSPVILEQVRPHLERFGVKFALIFKSIEVLRSIPADALHRYDRWHPWYRLLFDYPEDFMSGTCPPLHCWTVNDRATVNALTDLAARIPIEAIMTDDIGLAVGTVKMSHKEEPAHSLRKSIGG